MIRELHIARSFKTDIKKLNKKEKNDTKEVVLKLLLGAFPCLFVLLAIFWQLTFL